jgi:tetratricopeptide (TPR) repeat protein
MALAALHRAVDPDALSDLMPWWRSEQTFTLLMTGSGVLTCIAVIWLMVSWRRHVVHPLRELAIRMAQEPANADLYWVRGSIYLSETGLAKQAVAEFTRAIELEPSAWDLYDARADAHATARDDDQAILDRTRAIALLAESGELAAKHYGLYADRGLEHARAGDHQRAMADLTEAIRLLAADPEAGRVIRAILLYRRARAHQRGGNQASAHQDFREAHRYDRFWFLDPRLRGDLVRAIPGLVIIAVLVFIYCWLIG